MSKRKITYIHVFIWLFALFANLPYTHFGKDLPAEQIVAYLIGFLYLMLVFYLFYLFLVPYFLNRKKIGEFFGFSLLVVLIMPFFGYSILFLSRALFEGSFHNFYSDYSLRMHMSGFYPVLTAAVFGSFFSVIINWFTAMNQKAELDKQKLAVELDLLKSKLNPHFLFNTLNNIDSLIHQNHEEASAALIRLSEMMRYLTYETSSEVVDLKREIEYIQNLIELYRIRIKTPEDIKFEAEGDLNVMISPALFVPLIENAFKFASFRIKKPCVDIKLSSVRGVVVFEISNHFEKNANLSKSGHSGYGIINLKKRLALTYPDNYQLIIESGKLCIMLNSQLIPMQINCIIIDDEPLAISKLEGFISKVPDLKLIRTFDNPIEAIGWLRENSTDLIFLDIQMEQLTGIQFLEATRLLSRVILTTAYDQYAIKGFELNVTDYLLKPFSFHRFLQAVNRVMEYYAREPEQRKKSIENNSFIFVKTEYRLERVDINEILYIQGMKDYLRIICNDKKIMTLQSFSKIEESLPSKKFCRVHKSFIVAIDKIKSIERNVVLIADQRIPVSNTYKENFYSKIKH